MRAIIGCEESQAVTIELRELGVEAYSCDLQECSGEHPEWHYKEDILYVLKHNRFDLGIFFPPCTDLAVSGAKHFPEKIADGRQQRAIRFFMKMIEAPVKYCAVENPVGIMSTVYRKPDQIVHPYFFGDEFQKKTCLWLKNLPRLYHNSCLSLFDTEISHVDKGEMLQMKSGKVMPKWYADIPANEERGRLRGKTFPGIAREMASQWTEYILSRSQMTIK